MRLLGGALGAAVVSAALTAGAQSPPPAPRLYFNDYAGMVSAGDAARLNEKLAQFDQQSSNQVLVAIYPELTSPSLEDFTVRAAQAWKAGRGKLDNGVVLFVFVKDRKVRLEVGLRPGGRPARRHRQAHHRGPDHAGVPGRPARARPRGRHRRDHRGHARGVQGGGEASPPRPLRRRHTGWYSSS